MITKRGNDNPPSVRLFHAELKLEGCDASVLNNSRVISATLRESALAAKMHVLDVSTKIHRFKPQGITGYVLLSESHISIHTWPEFGKALVDILTCNSNHVARCIPIIKMRLKPKRIFLKRISNNQRWK